MLNNIVHADIELLIVFSCGYIVLNNQTILTPIKPEVALTEVFLDD